MIGRGGVSRQSCSPLAAGKALALVAAFAVGAQALPNGVPTKEGELTQIVKLTLASGICSGTIIGPNTVVTAAHCFEGLTNASVVITVPGDRDYEASGYLLNPKRNLSDILPPGVPDRAAWDRLSDDQKVQAITQSKEAVLKIYAEKLKHDLAVVQLAAPAEFKSYIPVQAHQPPSGFVGRKVTLVGYGITNGSGPGGIERTGSNTIRSSWAGLLIYLGLIRNREDQQPDGADAGLANGDSGGAMLLDGALVGVNTNFLDSNAEILGLHDVLGDASDSRPGEGPKGWSYAVSLSDPENVAFLKSAEPMGCKIVWAGDPAAAASPPAAASAPGRTNRTPKSKTLEALAQGGFSSAGR